MRKRRGQRKLDEVILEVLQEAGEVLHYREITRRVAQRGYRFLGKTPELSVVSYLSRNPEFKRVARGTYRVSRPDDDSPSDAS